ncbi:MAG: YbjP/YqhG family protein [Bacteroidales bacterium]|nr:YbjP/YqhG family protein [Bacteroidales bacterium]
MKKLFYFAAIVLMCACSNGKTQENQTPDSTKVDTTKVDTTKVDTIKQEVVEAPALDSEDVIKKRVKEIYAAPNEKTACTRSFKALIDKTREIDERLEGEIGFLDHDILTQAQDDITIKSIKISDITATRATAKIKTNWETLTVKLVKEDGVWKVDNVNDERKLMTEYIEYNSNN